jgi:hypothetical protein
MIQTNITMPFIGDRINRNTSYNEQDENVEQKIIFCFRAGAAVPGSTQYGRYFYGTTQKYNNIGSAMWCSYHLTYDGLYQSFWKKYNEMIINNNVTLSVKINFTVEQLLALNIMRLKEIGFQRMFIKSLSYNVGRNIKNNECEFFPVREYPNQIIDIEPTFAAQAYQWSKNWSEISAAEDSHNPGTQNYDTEWEFADGIDINEYLYLPPPTALGQIGYKKTVDIIVYVLFLGNRQEVSYNETVNIWYDSIPIL